MPAGTPFLPHLIRVCLAQLRERCDASLSPADAADLNGAFVQHVELDGKNWLPEWKRLPKQTSGVISEQRAKQQANPWSALDRSKISYKHREARYFLKKKGTLMIRYVVKNSHVVEGVTHELDMSRPADKQNAAQMFHEASTSMYVCWTNILHEYTVQNGDESLVVKKKFFFEELVKMPGEWRAPSGGILRFDHVILRPSGNFIGAVGFNVLKQQVSNHVRSGMAIQAVTDAFAYMNLAGGSSVKFSTVQAFQLLNMVPALRRQELAQLLYPSVTDFHNLFNILLSQPAKRQCMPETIADIVTCETGHIAGGRRSKWQSMAMFMNCNATAADTVRAMKENVGDSCRRTPDGAARPDGRPSSAIGSAIGSCRSKGKAPSAVGLDVSTIDIGLMYADRAHHTPTDQLAAEDKLQRWRRMSLDNRAPDGGTASSKPQPSAMPVASEQAKSAAVKPPHDPYQIVRPLTEEARQYWRVEQKNKSRPFVLSNSALSAPELPPEVRGKLLLARRLGTPADRARHQMGYNYNNERRTLPKPDISSKFRALRNKEAAEKARRKQESTSPQKPPPPGMVLRLEVARRQRARQRQLQQH